MGILYLLVEWRERCKYSITVLIIRLSQEGSNIIVDSPDIANTKFVPVSSNPVFYQIHIPSYRYQEQSMLSYLIVI